ncbi:MAG: hypothetical protein ACRDJF_03605 [Actinomycetota bacterium]
MGKKVVMFAVVMALVAGAAGLHFLSPAAAESGPSKAKATMLTLKETDSEGLDLGAKGLSAGDQFIFSGEFFKHESDEQVGHYDGYCVVINTSDAICTVTLVSDKGQTVGTGHVDFEDVKPGGSYKIPLVGGTDNFKGARGQFTVEVIDAKTAKLTVEGAR